MLNQVLETLSTLANVANSEATTLSKKQDEASKTKAKALYTHQSQIAALINRLANFEKMVAAQPDVVRHDLEPVVDAYHTILETMDKNLSQLHGVKHPDPRLNLALGFPVYGLITDAMQGLERNIELRKLYLLNLQQEAAAIQFSTSKDEVEAKERALQEKYEEYKKLCQEDEKLQEALANRRVDEVKKANIRWAQLLKQKFQKNDLPEIVEPKQAQTPQKGSGAMQWGRKFFTSIADLFSALKDPTNHNVNDKMMGLIGNLIHLIVSSFGSLFKKFLGNGPEAQKQVDDFANDATAFFTGMIASDSGMTCQQGKPCAKPGTSVPQTPKTFAPSFAASKTATQGTPFVASTPTAEQQPEAAKGSSWLPWNWF